MSVALSAEQLELRSVARRFFTLRSSEAEVRKAMDTADGFDRAVWSQLNEELGVQGMVVPEEFGGSGFSHVDFGVVLEEAGRSLLCAPMLSTALAVEALLVVGDVQANKELLPRLAEQGAIGTIGTLETAGQALYPDVATRAEWGPEGWLLSGEKHHVLDGQVSDIILVTARSGTSVGLFAVDAGASGLEATAMATLDQTRRQARIVLRRTPARLLGALDSGGRVVQRVHAAAAVFLAVEQVGSAQRALELAIDYSKTRHQYGRPIGSFQAVKHLCADVHTAIQAGWSIAYAGLRALDDDDSDLKLTASAAKVFCSQTLKQASAACIQIHGAIGFTWEHSAHLYFKRAASSALLFGTPSAHRESIADELKDRSSADGAQPGTAEDYTNSSGEDEAFRAEVRAWLAEHLVGEYAQHLGVGSADDAECWDVRLRWERELAAGGWLGLTWPREYGGRGAPLSHEIIFAEEYARAQAPYRVGVHGQDLFGPILLKYGTDDQKLRFLPPILAVEEFWGQGFSEPGAGSDLASLTTKARRDGDEWVIDGQKTWMTFGEYADWLYLLCRTDSDATKHRGISLIVVPVDQPGVEIRPIRNLAGANEFCEVFLTEARTAADNVIGPVDGGWQVAMTALAVERGNLLMPVQLGFQREIDDALAMARFRDVHRGLQDRLIDSWIAVRVMGAVNERTITEILQGRQPGDQAMTVKLFASQEHQRLLELAVEVKAEDATVTGPNYELDSLQRAYLLSRAETIYGGSSQVQRNIIAERLLGMPREPTRL